MIVRTAIAYTDEEMNKIIDVLKILSDICDDDQASDSVKHNASEAFDNLSTILCLDEKGEQSFYKNGW